MNWTTPPPTTNTPVLNCSVQFSPTNPTPNQSIAVKVNANAGGYSGKPPAKVQISLTNPTGVPAQSVGPKSTAPADQNNYTATFTISYAAAGNYEIDALIKDLTAKSTVTGTCKNTITVGTPAPPAGASCGISVSPSSFITPNTSVSITLSASAYSFTPGDTITYTLNMSGAVSGSSSGSSSSMSRGGRFSLGTHSVSGSVTATDTTADPQVSASNTCNTSFVSAWYPYLSIFGGDAEAGVSPQADGSAYTYTGAGFLGWNDGGGWGGGGSGGYGSAGAQWAVQALGGIYRFASARGTTATTVPYYLSFANNPKPNSSYGGAFGSGGNVQSDYRKYISKGTVSCASGGAVTTDVATSITGTKSCVVNGNVYISSNQVYATSGSWSIGSIPSFRLIVVGGNIYIDGNVGELDGTYVAVPQKNGASYTGGTIYTCTQGPNPPSLGSDYLGQCPNQLKVYGALVAKKVQFGRAYGTYTNTLDTWNNTAAGDALIYGPEMWLSTDGNADGVSSITGLPPVL